MTSALTHPLRLLSTVAALIALSLLGNAGPAGATAEETIDLPFEVFSIEHDQTTNSFLVGHRAEEQTPCGQRGLSIVERDGAISWTVPAPQPCTWLVHDGELFVATNNTIRFFDMESGTLIREWVLDEAVTVGKMFRGGPILWFNTATDVGQIRRELAIGSLAPGVQDSVGVAFNDVTLLAVGGEGRFLYFIDRMRLLTRFDQSGDTQAIEMATSNALYTNHLEAHLSLDESLLYFGGGQSLLLDAATLEERSDPDERRLSANSFDDLSDGRVLGIGGDATPGTGAARLFAQGTLDPIASGPYITGPNSGNNYTDAVVVNEPGFGDRLFVTTGSRIEIHAIAPAISGIALLGGGTAIEADTPRTIRLGIDWIDAIDTVSVNGQVLTSRRAFDEFGGWPLGLDVDLPALPAGTHLIEFDGPLGRSSDTAANRITVVPEQPRTDLEILVRSDSRDGEVSVGVACSSPDAAYDTPFDVTFQEIMRAGSRFTLRPRIGDTCRISYERYDDRVMPIGYLSGGWFDPVTDPGGWGMLDFETRAVETTISATPIGFAVFLPDPDEVVLWTYAYGFGQDPGGERTITLDCAGTANDETYQIYYGYWYRSVVPAQGCMLEHAQPDGSVGSGWAEFIPETGDLRNVNWGFPRRSVGNGPISTLFTVDVYPHPSEHNGAFARQQYLDFLGRQGDSGGLRFWEDALNSGARARTDLVQLFLDSPEFGGTVAPVNRLYLAYFGRAPDRGGLFFWVNWIRDGRTLGQVSDEFARSPEFTRTYGSLSDEDFIDLVYRNVLGRPADAGGRAFWIDRMAAGVTRGQIMANFSESPEYVEQTSAAVLVESLYQGLLQRSPDPQGFAFWTGQVEAGASIDNLIAGMLASEEYFNRFDNIVDELPSGRTQQLQQPHQVLGSGLTGDSFELLLGPKPGEALVPPR